MLERENDFYCLRDDLLLDKRTRKEITPTWLSETTSSGALRGQDSFYGRDVLVSRRVYDGNARLIGTAKDLGYSQSGQAVLLVETPSHEAWVPLSDIAIMGDIILLRKDATLTAKDGTVVF